jgi:hypothetical protein
MLIPARLQTQVSSATGPLVHTQARFPEGSLPGGPNDGCDESQGADGVVSEGAGHGSELEEHVARLVRPAKKVRTSTYK